MKSLKTQTVVTRKAYRTKLLKSRRRRRQIKCWIFVEVRIILLDLPRFVPNSLFVNMQEVKDKPQDIEQPRAEANDTKLISQSGDNVSLPESDQPEIKLESSSGSVVPPPPKASEPIEIPSKPKDKDTIVVQISDNESSNNENIVDATLDLWSLRLQLEEEKKEIPIISHVPEDKNIVLTSYAKRSLSPYHVRRPTLGLHYSFPKNSLFLEVESLDTKTEEPPSVARRSTFALNRKPTLASLKASSSDIVKEIISKVRKEWERTAELLPIAIDVPRLFRNVEIITVDGEAIVFPRQQSQTVVSETSLSSFGCKKIFFF
jgi:hypothetical protein